MNNKGVTVTSLIIYVIGMVVLIGVISTLTTFFYKNIDMANINNDNSQYTKFSSVFLEEINKENNEIIDCKTSIEDGMMISYVVFISGNQYTFMEENGAIYKNKIKLCNGIEKCEFSLNSNISIKVDFKAGNIDMTGDNAVEYTLKNRKL